MHVTARALAKVKGERVDLVGAGVLACGADNKLPNACIVVLPRLGDDGRWHDSERASDYRLAPPDAVPTCPACAVLWDAAHEGG